MEDVKALKSLDDPDASLPFIRDILSTLRSEAGAHTRPRFSSTLAVFDT
jgi:hypothetical protein